jgi:uncharacterized protein YxeA
MKKIAMTLLATAVAIPMMFAADAPKTDPAAPATKTTKRHKKAKKTTTSVAPAKAVSVK